MVSLGCVIKDPNAGIYMKACKTLSSFLDSSTTKLIGIQWAMELSKDLKIEEMMFYYEVLGIVDSVNRVAYNATLDFVVKYCKTILCSFRNVALVFISRDLNIEAHHMVGVGKALGSRSWFGHFPSSKDLSVPLASLVDV